VKNRLLCLLLVCVLLAINGCRTTSETQPQSGKETGKRGGRLVITERSAPQTFNFLSAADASSINVAFFLMASRLVEFDHDNQKFTAGLAEFWQTGTDGKTVTVKLRDSLKFSDGAPLTADDVVFTLKAMTDEKLHSPAFYDAMRIDDQPITASRVDERTVQLNLPRPVAAIENYLYNLAVLPRHKLESARSIQTTAATSPTSGNSEPWSLTASPGEFAVSGAFTLKEYVAGQRVILRRNPNYWKKDTSGTQLPYLDELVVEILPATDTALLKLQQGEIDILDDVRPADYAVLRDQAAGLTMRDLGPRLQTEFFWFNLNDGRNADGKPFVDPIRRAWFSDVRFRRAMAHAMDRSAMIQNIQRGLATELRGPVSPGNKLWINQNLPAYQHDTSKAQELLREAGFQMSNQNGHALLTDKTGRTVEFTLIVPETVPVRKQMATMIQEDLAKIGVKVTISALEDKAFSELMRKSLKYEAAIFGISPTDTDPSTLSSLLKTGGGQRFWFLNQKQASADWEKQMDQLMDEQSTESIAAKRREKFNEVQKIFAEQLPMIPLMTRHFISGGRVGLGNYRSSFILPRSLWNADEIFWKK
jgi:peptide/nickel transport system substrate-binding protein